MANYYYFFWIGTEFLGLLNIHFYTVLKPEMVQRGKRKVGENLSMTLLLFDHLHALSGSNTFQSTVMQKIVVVMGRVLLAPIEWKQTSKNTDTVAKLKLYCAFQVLIIPFIICIIRNWLWKTASWPQHKRAHIPNNLGHPKGMNLFIKYWNFTF